MILSLLNSNLGADPHVQELSTYYHTPTRPIPSAYNKTKIDILYFDNTKFSSSLILGFISKYHLGLIISLQIDTDVLHNHHRFPDFLKQRGTPKFNH